MSSRSNPRVTASRGFFFVTLLGLTVAACDCSDEVIRPCDSANPPAACGMTCTSDTSCTGGTYCGDDGTCTADCAPGDGNCGSGEICNPTDGRCIPDPSGSGGGTGGGTGSGGGAGGGDGGACQNLSVTADPTEPYIVFVLDRSGSMTAEYPPDDSTDCSSSSCPSRWDAMRNVLVGDGNGPLPQGVIEQFQGAANIAVVQYTGLGDSHDGTPTTSDFDSIWPLLIETPSALNNLAAIAGDFLPQGNGNPPGQGDTPTGESLWVTLCHLGPVVDTDANDVPDARIGCSSYTDNTVVPMSLRPALETATPTLLPAPAARDLAAPIIFVLATDGEPDSSVDPDPNSNDSAEGRTARGMTIDAVGEARAAGIPTYVISVTLSAELNKHLEHVACEGGTGPTPADAPYSDASEPVCTIPGNASGPGLIEAYDSDALRTALVEDIIGPSIPCDFQLEARVDASTVDEARVEGMVTIDGAPVSLAPGGVGDGWWLEDDGLTFRLLGTACDTFRANPGAELVANFTCDSGVIIIPL